MRVADILHGKGATVQTVSQDATVRDVLALLAEHNIGALVVTADGQAVAGIVSERDIVRCLHQSADALRHRAGVVHHDSGRGNQRADGVGGRAHAADDRP